MEVSRWRRAAAPIIAQAIAEVGINDMKALRRRLREDYPFDVRKYWPYKIWCDEVKRQLERAMAPAIREIQGPLFP